MEHDPGNPILDSRNRHGRNGSSPPSEMPKPSKATEAIIRELDIRFPPNNTISEADREAQVLFLASDVSDLPVQKLRHAAREWVRRHAWMPKASELRNFAGTYREQTDDSNEAAVKGFRVTGKYNLQIEGDEERYKRGIRWTYDERSDQMKLVPLDEYRAWEAGLTDRQRRLLIAA